MAESICEVCGEKAVNKKRNPPRFCSMECRKVGFNHTDETKIKLSKSHTGKKFEKDHKENHLKAMRKLTSQPEYIKKMSRVKKGKTMPINSLAGASEKNKNAKDWWFIKDGKHYKFRSLNKFVRDNKHLFTEDELKEYRTEKRAFPVYRATVMLRNLHLLKKDGTPAIPSHEWHGWTIGEKWEQGFYEK